MSCAWLLAVLAACSRNEPFSLGTAVSRDCAAAAEVRYFPIGTITGYPADFDGDLFLRRWYSQSLSAMHEPSLFCGGAQDDEAYRFLWLPTWGHPVSIRIFRTGNRYGLESVVLSGSGGYDPGQISTHVVSDLSPAQWRRFTAVLEEKSFWQTTTTADDTVGNDGDQWIVEGRRSGRYHFVDRWNGADRANAVRPLGMMLLDFSELPIRPT